MNSSKDIRGFFAKKPPTAKSGTTTPTRTKAMPVQPTSRDDVIRGSDDEDEDSDDSLESLSEIAGRQRNPGPSALATATPQAKRIASGSSRAAPVSQAQPKKHKFDLKALIKHAQEDFAVDESARRAEALLKLDAANNKKETQVLDKGKDESHSTAMREAAKDLLRGDEEGTKGDKLVRAMNRTAGDASQPHYYFFEFEEPSRDARKTPFPKLAAKSQWSFLADSSTRDETFVRGLPTALASKGKELPEELYQWILDEVCLEKNMQLRMQYCNLITLCPANTRRLVDVKRLRQILERIGSRKFLKENSKWHLSPAMEQPYGERNWSPVSTFLKLLERMAPDLAPETMIGAIQILIRMSLDPIVSKDIRIRIDHFSTTEALVSALPGTDGQWNDCWRGKDTAPSDRHIPPPPSTPRLCELRRRLAAASLFQQPGLGSSHPDYALSRKDILARLDAPDFRVSHETDYEELHANVKLLDVIIDDGSFLRSGSNPTHNSTPTTPANPAGTLKKPLPSAVSISSSNTSGISAEEFDKFIDMLNRKLKFMHDTISDNSLVSRKEAKAAIDTVGKRLAHTVRTRPPPKTNIVDDLIGQTKRDEEAGKPKQREFMKRWALQKKNDVVGNDDSDL
ncbi:uncharacterized protein PG998_012497 [Apiospora kogelbergensis]|uniref:uncharacterized protein n=1 Tax=Apiospora kogelbergensis TaxID=1337665 RepID=UPI0031306C16